MANWAKVDAYKLLKLTFGGSGYDIACAKYDKPIHFRNLKDKISVKEVNFDPVFKENIFFIYLGEKQNTREGIEKYRSRNNDLIHEIKKEFIHINQSILKTKDIKEFEKYLTSVLFCELPLETNNFIEGTLFNVF